MSIGWITRASQKEEQRQRLLQIQAGQASGIDWAACLVLQALHDKYGFGRKRFVTMNDKFEEKVGKFQGCCRDWRDELEKKGFKASMMYRFVDKITAAIVGNRKDPALKVQVSNMLQGALIVVFYTLRKDYGFGPKRIHDLQKYIADYAWLIHKQEVSIYEFMECLTRECDVEFPVLEEYVKVHGRPKIYG